MTKEPRYFYDADATREPAEWARWGDQTNGKHEGSGTGAGWIASRPKHELQRPQSRRAMELFEQHGLTDAHLAAIRAVGITDAGKAQHTQDGFGKSDPEVQALADEAKAALGGYYREFLIPNGRNARSVWEIATQPYPEAHFATFPEELARRCIAAGTSERGCCPECGAPWERKVDRTAYEPPIAADGERFVDASRSDKTRKLSGAAYNASVRVLGERWIPSCGHNQAPIPCVVLDPFMGSGTVAHVARKLGRRSIGIELNPDYCELAARRLQQQSLLA